MLGSFVSLKGLICHIVNLWWAAHSLILKHLLFLKWRDSSAFHLVLWFKHCSFCHPCFLLTISQACPDAVSMVTCPPFNLFDQGAYNVVQLCNCNLKTAGDILKQKQWDPAKSLHPIHLINVITKPLDFWVEITFFIYEKYDIIKERKTYTVQQQLPGEYWNKTWENTEEYMYIIFWFVNLWDLTLNLSHFRNSKGNLISGTTWYISYCIISYHISYIIMQLNIKEYNKARKFI